VDAKTPFSKAGHVLIHARLLAQCFPAASSVR